MNVGRKKVPHDMHLQTRASRIFQPENVLSQARVLGILSEARAGARGLTRWVLLCSLPADPRQWTETHVRDWVMWAVNEFSLKGVDFQKFCMNGAALCALGKDCFLELAPDFVGDILWEHLEILQKGTCVWVGDARVSR